MRTNYELATKNWRDIEPSFDKITRDFFNRFFSDKNYLGNLQNAASYPKVDIVNFADKTEIHAAIPGLKREDVKVELNKGILYISSEKTSTLEHDGGLEVWRELHRSRFSRAFAISKDHDYESITAELKDGILSILISKKREAISKNEVKTIEVK